MKTEKLPSDCLRESVELMKKISTLGIPLDCPEVAELRARLNAYARDGECWSGTINFLAFGRIADVNLPRRADKSIEVTLRVPLIGVNKSR